MSEPQKSKESETVTPDDTTVSTPKAPEEAALSDSLIDTSKHICVLGGGSFGTAIASMLARNNHDVVILDRNENRVKVRQHCFCHHPLSDV